MWVAAILLINEVPDISADNATGKHTLAVRLGTGGTGVLYAAMHLFAVAVIAWMAYQRLLPVYAIVIPAGLLILALNAAAAVRNNATDRPRMTKAIEATLAIHTLGSVWMTAVALFLAFSGA
jgi:1,4-dihydroxy-2-naphthoate octaprenyltransferase